MSGSLGIFMRLMMIYDGLGPKHLGKHTIGAGL